MGSALASRLRLKFAVLGFDVAPAKRAAGADPPQAQGCEQLAELATAEGCGRLDDAAVAKLWKQWLGTSLATKSADEA
jgi:hypothetical protein